MACGAPVIASDIPVTREVVEDAAVLVPPDRPDACAVELARMLADPDRRKALGIRGLARSAAFTPEASAAPVLETIERVVAATRRAPG
jgi:glycosyltransferase involved in cell wall biosynthesis